MYHVECWRYEMKIDFRIHLGMFIERALVELNMLSIDQYAYHKGVYSCIDEESNMEDILYNYVKFFPLLDLDDYIHLFSHPLKNDLEKFVTTMRKVLIDILLHKKYQFKFDAAISYFKKHPSLEVDEMINQMEIDWSQNDNNYWEEAFNKLTNNFSYSSEEREITFTNVEDLYPVNSTEEKYFTNEDYLAILKSRDLSSGISLCTEPSGNDASFTPEEKACRDFIRILIHEYYLPFIMNYDSELRSFIASIEEIVEEKFDLLQSKLSRGIYKNEWGVMILDQWVRDLRYFASNVVLDSLTEPSFLLGLKMDSVDFADFLDYFIDENVKHGIVSYGPNFMAIDEEFKDLFQVTDAIYRNNIVDKVAKLSDFLLRIKIIKRIKSAPKNEDTTVISSGSNDLMEFNNNHDNVDAVTVGSVYESQVRNYLENLGYSIKITPKTGDQGVDLIAEKNGKKFAIQCKYYTGQVGNAAVQEVFAGKYYYDCDYACVVTNSTFTPSALSLANKTRVLLCSDNNLQIFH